MTPARCPAIAIAGLAAWLLSGCDSSLSVSVDTLEPPPEVRSVDGELRTTLTAAETTVQVAGKSVRTIVYNGEYMPPLLRVSPGDTIYLNLVNQSDEPTNEHYHGLNVSPRINDDGTVSDDILISAEPGTQVNYKIEIPANHNPGLYWYHAHLHTLAEKQIMGGLSGGLIVDGILDPFPELAGIKEQVMLLKDIQITPQGTLPDDIDPGGETNRTINGQSLPTLVIHPGELQFWRIGNIGADLYYRIRLEGHVFYELARDGNRHNQLVPMDEILLPPGSRSEVLIRGGKPGITALRTLNVNTGPDGDDYAEATLATVVTRGPAQTEIPLPAVLPPVEDFRLLPVARSRTITFIDGPGNVFYIDSGEGPKQFDPNVVDSTITVGTVEEWTINNTSGEFHAFHIHQTDFQVTEINGVPQDFVGHQDNVNVPYQEGDDGPPGQVKVLIDFRNPVIVGKFVYHCHILEHEDGGMMAIAEVVNPAAALSPGTAERGLRAGGWTAPDQRVTENTLAAFQAGSYCSTDTALPRRSTAAVTGPSAPFRIQRLQVRSAR